MDIYKNQEAKYILKSIVEQFMEEFYKGLT